MRLDLSMAAYLSAIPFLIWYVFGFWSNPFFKKINRVLIWLFIVLVVFICLTNIGNYPNWGTVINKRVLLYFEKPSEIFHFMSTWQLFLLPVAIIGIVLLVNYTYNKIVRHRYLVSGSVKKHALNILWIPVLVLFLRGGWQLVPVGESAAYYSPHNSNNHASVNPVFYFFHSVSEYFYVSEKYKFFDEEKSVSLFNELMTETNRDTIVLTEVKKPNLVIIILESWVADVLETVSGEKEITPFTGSLIERSLFFEKCYGSGYRTDQGLVSVLAGYPSQPDNSIIAYPSKTEKLPSICKHLNKNNYHSSFFYGGDLEFANMKSFILQQGFQTLSDKNNYDEKDQNSKWGAHDNLVLQKQIETLNNEKGNFLSVLLTLSTHEPFEIPLTPKFPHTTVENKFRNAAWFTDESLKDYFALAEKSEWYKNTLILLVADHGHHLPLNRNLNMPESKRITCILTGGALNEKLKGFRWKKPMAQHDLIKMLAPYFNFDVKNYPFAHDPFSAKHPFGYYSNENVLGLVTDSSNYKLEIPTQKANLEGTCADFAKAYLQVIYKDFVNQ